MDKVYCNPLEIAYKYQHPLHGDYAYKEAADPTLIRFNGLYLLFTSKCGGFYYSENLFDWKFYEDRKLEIHGYAPDVNDTTDTYISALRPTQKSVKYCVRKILSKASRWCQYHLRFGIRIFISKVISAICIGAVPLKSPYTVLKWTSKR